MPSPSASELRQLTRMRLAEARSLLAAAHYPGAWYVAGYSMELALKACVCACLKLPIYPENEVKKAFFTHQIADLVLLAGLRDALQAEQNRNAIFATNWSFAETWSPSHRYDPARSQTDAEALVGALADQENGVIQWLSRQW